VMAEAEGEAKRAQLAEAEAVFATGHPVTALFDPGRAEQVIPQVVGATGNPLLLMGAYGHSPLRRMIIGSTTTAMIRTVKAPVLLVR
jgi:nucleotide-binding universal stress UspA family protein